MTWPGGAWDRGRDEGDLDVVLLGDSITAGQSATHLARSYAWMLRAALRTIYGDGGSGFNIYATNSVGGGVLSGGGTTGAAFAPAVPNGGVVTLTGAGCRLTVVAEGTLVAVYLRRAAGDGTGRWRVDGGPWQAVSCAGATGYLRVSADSLTTGTHTIDIECVTGTIAVAGSEGRNITGARLHVMGLGQRTSGGNLLGGVTSEANATFRAATIGRWAPHLLIVNLGVNDSNGAVATATYKANIEAHIVAARAIRSDCDVVLVANHLGKFTDTDYDGKIVALRQLVDVYGGLVVDLDTWARTVPGSTTLLPRATPIDACSWARWSRWGWWDDAVHPGDVGHAALAYVLGRVLTAADEAPTEPEFIIGGTYP